MPEHYSYLLNLYMLTSTYFFSTAIYSPVVVGFFCLYTTINILSIRSLIRSRADILKPAGKTAGFAQAIQTSHQLDNMFARFTPSWARLSCRGMAPRPSASLRFQYFQDARRCFPRDSILREQSNSAAPFSTEQSQQRNTSAM